MSAFTVLEQSKSSNAIPLCIKESLKSKMGNRIGFANTILKNEKIIKGKPRVYDSLSKYKNMGSYDILKDRGEHVTLFQLMYSLVNGNRDISVFWVLDI